MRMISVTTALTSVLVCCCFACCFFVSIAQMMTTAERHLTAASPFHVAFNRVQDRPNVRRPLDIHGDIDQYIANDLPQPNDNLAKIYAKSSLVPDAEPSVSPPRFVVLTFANADYFENHLITNWMCSLHSRGIDNFVVIPIDEAAAHAAFETDDSVLPPESIYWDSSYWNLQGGSEDSSFSQRLRAGYEVTEIFLEFIWRRAQLVRTLLERYPDLNVVLSDADTTWASSPWDVVPEYFNQTNSCDMFFTNDVEYGETEVPVRTVEPLSGFILIRNRDIVRQLYQRWVKAALVFHNKDQPSLRAAIQTFKMKYLIESIEYDQPKEKFPLVLCTLDRKHFPTIQFIQSGLHGEMYPNAEDQIALYHPNFAEKDEKPFFFKKHNQWYLDTSNLTCSKPRGTIATTF